MFCIDFFNVWFIIIMMKSLQKKDLFSRKFTEHDREILHSYIGVRTASAKFSETAAKRQFTRLRIRSNPSFISTTVILPAGR